MPCLENSSTNTFVLVMLVLSVCVDLLRKAVTATLSRTITMTVSPQVHCVQACPLSFLSLRATTAVDFPPCLLTAFFVLSTIRFTSWGRNLLLSRLKKCVVTLISIYLYLGFQFIKAVPFGTESCASWHIGFVFFNSSHVISEVLGGDLSHHELLFFKLILL